MLRLVIEGENLDFVLGLLDWVTVAFEHRSLPKGVGVKEHRLPCDVMR